MTERDRKRLPSLRFPTHTESARENLTHTRAPPNRKQNVGMNVILVSIDISYYTRKGCSDFHVPTFAIG